MNKIKSLMDSYLIALPLGTTLVMLYLMVMASFSDWTIIIDFNKYGEGKIELILMILWVALLGFKGLQQLEKKQDEKTRKNTRDKKIPDINQNTRKQYIDL